MVFGGYKAEVDALRHINALIGQGVITIHRQEGRLWKSSQKTPARLFQHFFVGKRNEVDEAFRPIAEANAFATIGLHRPAKPAG